MSRSTFLLACGLLAFVGCGGDFDYGSTGQITGVLTLDGKPLDPGYVVNFMEPMKGYLAFGTTDAEGKFTVNTWNNGKMPVGPYRVFIAPPRDPSEDLTPEQRMDAPARPQAKPTAMPPPMASHGESG